MAAINNNNFELFTFMNEFMLDDSDDELFVLYRNNSILGLLMGLYNINPRVDLPKLHGYVENIIPQFLEEDFVTHYRVSRRVFDEILLRITPQLLRTHTGGVEQVAPNKQLLAFLCYMSNMETMREVGNYFGLSKSTVHGIIRRASSTLNEVLGHLISWPDHAEQQDIAVEFQLQSHLPDVIGCVDGTHIRLSNVQGGDADYINRKGYPSVQLQVVSDNRMLIRHAYTGWPGSTHDARVLRQSSLYELGENSNKIAQNKYILADSAYPIREWLITPFRDNGHLNQQQRRFNRALSSSRQVVERCIGLLKGRFRRLREITLHILEDIVQNIISGCILHNLCILRNYNIEQFMDDVDEDPNQYQNIFNAAITGMEKRQQLVNYLP